MTYKTYENCDICGQAQSEFTILYGLLNGNLRADKGIQNDKTTFDVKNVQYVNS